jgi:hypothetical protein
MAKQEREFFDPSDLPWQPVEGYPDGVWEKILSYDEETGARTRLTRFDPGVVTAGPLIHEFWEEVYVISGGFVVGEEVYTAGMAAIRPPGMPHGPFHSPVGCLTFEVQYYKR